MEKCGDRIEEAASYHPTSLVPGDSPDFRLIFDNLAFECERGTVAERLQLCGESADWSRATGIRWWRSGYELNTARSDTLRNMTQMM